MTMSNHSLWPRNSRASTTVHEAGTGTDDSPGVWTDKLSDGTPVLIRPIADTDINIERRFIERLSPTSRRLRFLGTMSTPDAHLLRQFTHLDHATEVAFIALHADNGEQQEIGVSRYSARSDGLGCECAVAVSDEWQHRGLGTLLMQHLIDTARLRGIDAMYSMDAADNVAMRDLADHLGFQRTSDPNDATQVIHRLDLSVSTTIF
jgi:GNAT superfamily N-acetyltransferase